MGLTTISNGKLTAVISDKGAEPQSLIYKGTEYLWQGDPAFWNRRAPILFPFVGRCVGDAYSYAGGVYKMKQHGFARDNVFDLVSAGETAASFELRSNPELKKIYPFDFSLLVEYRIEGSSLNVKYTVTNTGNNVMFFSIGSHEAYRCPLCEGERFEDYTVTFNRNERLDRYYLEDGLVSRGSDPFIDFGQSLHLKHDYFLKSVAVLKNIRSNQVTLKNQETGRGVEVSFDGFCDFGVWQAPNAPFLALEPWQGMSDPVGYCGELPTKPDVVRLNTGASKVFTHRVTVF